MEGLKSVYDRLKDVRSRAQKLIDAGAALSAWFAEEETRLEREDEVSILRGVRCSIADQSQRLRGVEASASCEHSRASAVSFLTGLIATAMISKDNRRSAMRDYLLRQSTNRKEPFGLVMVCIGSKGLPRDVGVVSISQLARESNRSHPEVINRLLDDGCLVFTEEAFSLLIDRLVDDVRIGKLNLPVSRDELAKIVGLVKAQPSIKLIESS